jgi:hypothetical protein
MRVRDAGLFLLVPVKIVAYNFLYVRNRGGMRRAAVR